jgi:hypothetical protein
MRFFRVPAALPRVASWINFLVVVTEKTS